MLKASVIGNLGADAELRYSPSGQAFLRMNVACNYRARSPEGEWQDRTEWVRATLFGQQAERLSQYLRKGTKVYVDGRLEARPWTDQQGQVRAGLEVIANDLQFMSGRADEERTGGEGGQEHGGRESEVGGTAGPAQGARDRTPAPSSDDGGLEDLPF